jgi:Pre-mRNA splicing Prp18-interacting factor
MRHVLRKPLLSYESHCLVLLCVLYLTSLCYAFYCYTYLLAINTNSAYYDPKTRAMRDNPNPSANPEDLAFAGDNFSRYSGDVKNYAQTQVYAWDAANRGQVSNSIYNMQ